MTDPAASFPPPRITPNHRHAFGGVWRLTFRRFLGGPGQWLAFAAMLLLLGLLEFAIVRDGRARAFSDWTVRMYFGFLIPAVAFLSGAGAIRDEMKSGSVDYVLTRPVLRPAFIVFKFFSHLACLQLAALVALAVVLVVADLRHVTGLGEVLPWLLLAQGIAITAFMALGFFCGVMTSRFLVLGLAYGAVVEAGLGRTPTQLSRLSLTHQITGMLEPIMPAAAPGLPTDQTALGTVGAVLAFAAVMLAIVMVVFRLRELVGEHTREV